ncbi:MAG: aminotransferase class IV [Limisphaerales bacterium]
MLAFLNGGFVPEERAVISIFDRGFLYGDGLFETIRVFNGRPFRWRRHMARLGAGARFLRIKLPYSSNQLEAIADKLIARNKRPNSLLRIALSRGIGAPGYLPKNGGNPTLVMSQRPAPKLDPKHMPQWKLFTASYRAAANDPLAHFKTSNKLLQVLARTEAARAGADEALLLNTKGFIAEAAGSNVFWVNGGELYTPPFTAGVLPGVTRELVFEIAADLDIPIHQKNARLEALRRTDGIFLSLTSWGIVEVTLLDGKRVKRAGMTKRIQRAYVEMIGSM